MVGWCSSAKRKIRYWPRPGKDRSTLFPCLVIQFLPNLLAWLQARERVLRVGKNPAFPLLDLRFRSVRCFKIARSGTNVQSMPIMLFIRLTTGYGACYFPAHASLLTLLWASICYRSMELRLDMRSKECWHWKGIGLYDGGTGFPLSTPVHPHFLDIRLYRNRERYLT